MSLGLALVIIGVVLAVFVHAVLGIVLAIIGVVLMVNGRG